MSHLSHRPSNSAYHIEDCWILGNLHSLHLGSIFQDFLGHWSCHTDEYGNRAYWRPSVSNSSGYERSKVTSFVEL